jgi:hypothetical protein
MPQSRTLSDFFAEVLFLLASSSLQILQQKAAALLETVPSAGVLVIDEAISLLFFSFLLDCLQITLPE